MSINETLETKTDPELKPMFTVEEFAKLTRVCVETARRMVRRGDIRARRLGRGYRIAASELTKFVS